MKLLPPGNITSKSEAFFTASSYLKKRIVEEYAFVNEHEQKQKQAPHTEDGHVTASLKHAQTVCKTENSTYEIGAAADCEWPAWHAVRVSCERPRGRQRETAIRKDCRREFFAIAEDVEQLREQEQRRGTAGHILGLWGE